MITALTPDETTGAAADAKDPALQALLCLRSLWNAYAGHEQAYGDLASLRKIKQRRADALGIGDMSDRAYLNTTRAQAGQWGCFGLDGVARELGMASTTSSSSRRVATTHVGIGIDFADTGLEEDLFDLETKGKRSGDRRIKLVTKAVPADWRDRNRNCRSSRSSNTGHRPYGARSARI
ncbi:hypothetical protein CAUPRSCDRAFT_13058 [Caulochytrium protostelioides]|uniref:Uncharacterized protein n=1 Tax=Caulochytrium protostelioides TaxID=1555241 RepID=A0A4P9WQB2_9FUNG|nr:hypothetical protein CAUPRSCDRAFT_13058 [Caulochytrium protostelioides]